MEAFTFSDKNTISGEMWDLTLVDKIKKFRILTFLMLPSLPLQSAGFGNPNCLQHGHMTESIKGFL